MGKNVTLNDGFTLVEVLVSMVIMLIVFMALLRALAIYTQNNVQNEVRNAAINIAENCYNKLSSLQNCPQIVTVDIRSFLLNYCVYTSENIDNFTSGANKVSIFVRYLFPKKTKGICSNDNKSCTSDSDCKGGCCYNHEITMDTVVYK